jgi:NADPH:quinone reductase-like Zn-dependent oxidoreductase
MKKALFQKAGKPEEVLQISEQPIPEPGEGEVRVRVKASPVNPSDVMFVMGQYGIRPQLPSGGGFEGAGVIDALGAGVQLPLGAHVSFTCIGAWSEYAIVHQKSLFVLPSEIPFETGAQLFVNPFTAWAMLHESGLQEGDWLLLTAGGSTFAQLVIQMAHKKGIKTICTVRRNDQIAQLMALGATAVVNTEENFLPKKVKELTGGQWAKCCFDATGGDTSALAIQSLAPQGTMFIYGMLSLKETPLHNGLMIFKNMILKGFWLTTWMATAPREVRQQAAMDIISMFSQGLIKIETEATYPLSEAVEAIRHAESTGRKGKILIIP